MRQEKLTLEVLRKHDQQAIVGLQRRIEDHRRFLEYLVDIVGPDSIVNPVPRHIDAPGCDDQFLAPVQCEPLNIWDDRAVDKVRSTVVYALRTRVVQDRLRGALHFSARLRGGEVAYSISGQVIATLSTQQLASKLHQHIAQQLAHQLAQKLKR